MSNCYAKVISSRRVSILRQPFLAGYLCPTHHIDWLGLGFKQWSNITDVDIVEVKQMGIRAILFPLFPV